MPREAFEHGSIFTGLVEGLGHGLEVFRVNRFQAHENPLAAALSDQRDQFFVPQQVHADLCDPGDLRFLGDDLLEQGLGPSGIDGEVVVNEEDYEFSLPPFFQGL